MTNILFGQADLRKMFPLEEPMLRKELKKHVATTHVCLPCLSSHVEARGSYTGMRAQQMRLKILPICLLTVDSI